MKKKKEESINENISQVQSKKRDFKKNLLLLLMMIIIMIIIFEIFLRFFYPQKLYDNCYEYSGRDLSNLDVDFDPLLGWSSKKNFTGCAYQPDTNRIILKTHNSNGVRLNKEIPYEKGNKKRVLLLGDSFAYGFGVNDSDTFAVRLQENLGENYEVISLSASGYGTGQELLQLKHEGLKYNPDIVILFFFQNDIANTQQIDQAYADKPIFKLVKQIEIEGVDPSLKKQYIAKLLSGDKPQLNLLQSVMHPDDEAFIINNETIIVANYPTKMTWNDNYGAKKKPLSREKPFSAILLRFSHLYSLVYHKFSNRNSGKSKRYSERISDGQDRYLEKEYGKDAEEGIFLTLELFKEFERAGETKKYKFIVVNIPDKRNVNKEYQKKFLKQFIDVDESDFDFRKVDTIFSQNLSGSSIGYISLFDLAEKNFDEFYFKTDPHWNEKGIKLSADYIIEQLKEKKII